MKGLFKLLDFTLQELNLLLALVLILGTNLLLGKLRLEVLELLVEEVKRLSEVRVPHEGPQLKLCCLLVFYEPLR